MTEREHIQATQVVNKHLSLFSCMRIIVKVESLLCFCVSVWVFMCLLRRCLFSHNITLRRLPQHLWTTEPRSCALWDWEWSFSFRFWAFFPWTSLSRHTSSSSSLRFPIPLWMPETETQLSRFCISHFSVGQTLQWSCPHSVLFSIFTDVVQTLDRSHH